MLIAVAVVGGHLLPGLDATEIDREIRNGLHLIGFALIAAVIFEALSMRPLSAVVTTLLLVASLGALAEFVQSLDGKGYDLADLTRDVAGAATYLCARLVWNWTNAEARSSVARFSARLLSIVLGCVAIFSAELLVVCQRWYRGKVSNDYGFRRTLGRLHLFARQCASPTSEHNIDRQRIYGFVGRHSPPAPAMERAQYQAGGVRLVVIPVPHYADRNYRWP